MHMSSLLISILACSEPDAGDDSGTSGAPDGGSTAGDGGASTEDGGTSTVDLCREVITPFDDATAPVDAETMAAWHDAIRSLGEVEWTTSLDSTVVSDVYVGSAWTADLVIVDWVADGSAEALYPCMKGPATRASVDFNFTVVPNEAQGTLSGAMDSNGIDSWYTRMRTSSPGLSEDWQALVDSAEVDAGHTDATTFMSLSNPDGVPTVLTIGSETTSWSHAWWSGPLEEGDLVPH